MQQFKIKNVGPSTAETVEQQYQQYIEIQKYRNGKSFYELLDEANRPRLRLQ